MKCLLRWSDLSQESHILWQGGGLKAEQEGRADEVDKDAVPLSDWWWEREEASGQDAKKS